MAISILRPDYTAGTITLTSGSTAFTLTGGSLLTAAAENGDRLHLPDKGLSLTIESVTDATNGVLTNGCPAACAGANQNYRIRFQEEGSRLASWTRDMLLKLDSGNVEAFAELIGAPNRVPVFTGLGQIGLQSIQASPTDATAGAILEVGAFGLGGQIVSTEVDLNNYQTSGAYLTPSSGLLNTPSPLAAGRLIVEVWGGVSYAFQMVTSTVNPTQQYYRLFAGGWGAWTSCINAQGIAIPNLDYNQAVIPGIYGGSGNGAINPPPNSGNYGPMLVMARGTSALTQLAGFGGGANANSLSFRASTDSGATWSAWVSIIADFGSNSNGNWVRYSDGSQVCTKTITGIGPINLAWGTIFQSANFACGNYAASFVGVPDVSGFSWDTGTGINSIVSGSVPPTATSFGSAALVRGSAVTATTFVLSLTARGRWK